MSCTVTETGPCRRELSFTIEREVIDQEVDRAVSELARSVKLKGFREGKAPVHMIRKAHGKRLEEDVRRKVMGEAFQEAIREHDLRPVGDPEMNLEALQDDGEGPFTFGFAIEVAPQVDLVLADRIPVSVVVPPVKDEMIEAEIARIQEQAASLADAEDGAPIGPEDILEGTIVYTVDGVELEPRETRAVFLKHELVDAIPVEGSRALFEGGKQGDTVELEAELPAHFEPAEHGGKHASIRFTIDRHRIVVPAELDDELLKKLGVESEDELRARMRASLDAQRARFRNDQIDREVEKILLEENAVELPERLTAKAIDRRVHEYAHDLMKRESLSSEDGHHQAEEKRAEIADATRRGLHLAFLLDKIAAEHELQADVPAAEAQVRTLAQQQGSDPDATVTAAHQEGWLADVLEQLTHQNARDWLRQRADVTETEPAPIPAPPEAEAGA